MEDAYLASIVRYVEGGGEPVKVSMTLTSGVVVTGLIRPAAFFTAVSQQQVHDERSKVIRPPGETFRAAKARTDAAAKAGADQIAALFPDENGSGGEVITLSDVMIAWSNGDGLTLPTMRLNHDSIAAWWLGSTATPFKRSKDSGALFGVAIPLDL